MTIQMETWNSAAGCSHILSTISKAAFSENDKLQKKPSFAVATVSCWSVRKYFLEKLLQTFGALQYSNLQFQESEIYFWYINIKQNKTKKNQTPKINPLTGASLGVPGLSEHHCSHRAPTADLQIRTSECNTSIL